MTTHPQVDTSFVISPFGEPFDTYFSHILKPALEECGLYAVRGDSLYRPTTIVDDIWQGIQASKLLVAELTGRNPNVFYELGLAHAISKPVILIATSIEDVPFDLRSIRVLLYDKDHPNWGSRLRTALVSAVKEVLASPTSAIPSTFKTAVKPEAPEESAALMRLEALESMVHRLSDSLAPSSIDLSALPTIFPKGLRSNPTYLEPGQEVVHSKFGVGKVLTVEGQGRDARAQINFEKHGAKWLALAVARLDVLEK